MIAAERVVACHGQSRAPAAEILIQRRTAQNGQAAGASAIGAAAVREIERCVVAHYDVVRIACRGADCAHAGRAPFIKATIGGIDIVDQRRGSAIDRRVVESTTRIYLRRAIQCQGAGSERDAGRSLKRAGNGAVRRIEGHTTCARDIDVSRAAGRRPKHVGVVDGIGAGRVSELKRAARAVGEGLSAGEAALIDLESSVDRDGAASDWRKGQARGKLAADVHGQRARSSYRQVVVQGQSFWTRDLKIHHRVGKSAGRQSESGSSIRAASEINSAHTRAGLRECSARLVEVSTNLQGGCPSAAGKI